MPLRTLLIVPTAMERRALLAAGGGGGFDAPCAVCGFGPVAAAARTADLVARRRPARVVLAGLAGTLDAAALPVGAAAVFARVVMDGVGVGSGAAFLSAGAIGFSQWPGDDRPGGEPPGPGDGLQGGDPEGDDSQGDDRGPGVGRRAAAGAGGGGAIGDALSLAGADPSGPGAVSGPLVTCAAASASAAEARQRRARVPGAVAEEMEGFAAALACRLAGIPCAVVRGISNAAGDRDAAGWRIEAAMAAVRPLVADLIRRPTWEPAP